MACEERVERHTGVDEDLDGGDAAESREGEQNKWEEVQIGRWKAGQASGGLTFGCSSRVRSQAVLEGQD